MGNQELKQKKWCTKCEKLWDETTVYARRHKIKILDDSIKPVIRGRCIRGHTFEIPVKKLKQTFCSDCKTQKEDFKRNISENLDDLKQRQNMRIRQSSDDLLRKAHSHIESQILPDDEILKLFSSDFISKQPTLFNYLS